MDITSVALLVDGDNFNWELASSLTNKASALGDIRFRRVYCNARSQLKWDANPNFLTVHAGSGKNAADILLVVEALDLAFKGAADTFVLAGSDSDLRHLIGKLTELGKQVKWYGEESKSSPEVRDHWCFELIHVEDGHPPSDEDLQKLVAQVIDKHGSPETGLSVQQLGLKMSTDHSVVKAQLPQRSWTKWLQEYPRRYAVSDGYVRLQS